MRTNTLSPCLRTSRPLLKRKGRRFPSGHVVIARRRRTECRGSAQKRHLALFALGCQSEPLDVAHVDLQQMQGKWYEVASLPRPTQAGCTGTTAEYQLKSSNELLVILRYTEQ